MTAQADITSCRCCGKPRTRRPAGGWRGAHGWCHTCTERWRLAGKPATGVPARTGQAERIRRSLAARHAAREARIEDYTWLRRTGAPVEAAARRVGVTARTARGYERAWVAARQVAQETAGGTAA